jgi:hypothetical protein
MCRKAGSLYPVNVKPNPTSCIPLHSSSGWTDGVRSASLVSPFGRCIQLAKRFQTGAGEGGGQRVCDVFMVTADAVYFRFLSDLAIDWLLETVNFFYIGFALWFALSLSNYLLLFERFQCTFYGSMSS